MGHFSHNYQLICKNVYRSSYNQIALFDAEPSALYPLWKTGEEIIVFNQYGAGVAVANDQEIGVAVYTGWYFPDHKICVSSVISINNSGFLLGNIPSSSYEKFAFPKGSYYITVFTDAIGTRTRKVWFLLNPLEDS